MNNQHISPQKQQRRSCSPRDLVAQRLAGDDGDLLAHPLVGVEVTAQAGVVLLDDDPGGLLDCLGPDSTLKTDREKN